jgi:hypothetical protein
LSPAVVRIVCLHANIGGIFDKRLIMTFILKIELSNESMQSRLDVARILGMVATDVGSEEVFKRGDSGEIQDFDGQAVGEWRVTRTSDPPRAHS